MFQDVAYSEKYKKTIANLENKINRLIIKANICRLKRFLFNRKSYYK